MTATLRGLRIALLEARRSQELADLITRHGGEPHSVPALRETPRDGADVRAGVAAALDGLAKIPAPTAIFATGVGVEALFRVAETEGRRADLEAILRRAINVCRGPKPVAALKRVGMPIGVRAAPPHTTHELLEAIAPLSMDGALLVHHGERSDVVAQAVASKTSRCFELLLYAWEMPEDTSQLAALVSELVAGSVGAVAFTTQVQARHLFAVAEELGKRDALVDALQGRVIVVAIGPTCAETLRALGTPAHVVPESPKMGPMILSLARYLDEAGAQR